MLERKHYSFMTNFTNIIVIFLGLVVKQTTSHVNIFSNRPLQQCCYNNVATISRSAIVTTNILIISVR
jgi:hypothetical protein